MTNTILVNKENKFKESYLKKINLIKIKNIINEEIEIDDETYNSFLELKNHLKKKNIFIGIDSAYRSAEKQQELFDSFVIKYGIEYANKFIASPCFSEHQTGLAIDINLLIDNAYLDSNEELFEQKEIFKKIEKELHKYGFILRYPENKEEVTGYSYEPWHIRYVGKFVAKIIYEKKYTLEEYLKNFRGVILVNKEPGMTSFDVVNDISHLFGIKKVGHTGTLDPLAEGVLIVCIGQATKIVEILTASYKEYEAGVILGVKTDTLDITGKTIGVKSVPDLKKLECIINSWQKTYSQEVPIYSAVKVKGKKLYEYARNNEKVELPKKEVTIKKIDLLTSDNDTFLFRSLVSKGCYIRALIDDIGKSLNTYATMTSLKRTKQGRINIENTNTLSEIKNNKYKIYDIDEVLDYPIETVNEYQKDDIIHGRKIENNWNVKDKVILKDNQKNILGIYQITDNNMLKTWKNFNG